MFINFSNVLLWAVYPCVVIRYEQCMIYVSGNSMHQIIHYVGLNWQGKNQFSTTIDYQRPTFQQQSRFFCVDANT